MPSIIAAAAAATAVVMYSLRSFQYRNRQMSTAAAAVVVYAVGGVVAVPARSRPSAQTPRQSISY